MKKKKSKNNGEPQRVHFEFTSPTAESVCIAGTFNEWRENATPMIPLEPGHWAKDLVLPSGAYEYRLVVDGQWVSDPLARETVPNPFGSVNAVLKLGESAALAGGGGLASKGHLGAAAREGLFGI
jgi:1,4-alpha-glucan branching enzyme